MTFPPRNLCVWQTTGNSLRLEWEAVQAVFSNLSTKKHQTTIQTLLKISRLPTQNTQNFENFDFSLLKGKDVEWLQVLPSLNAIYYHRNLSFINPAGTGKLNLVQAFGYTSCQQGTKTYFIKAAELRDWFIATRRTGKTDSCLRLSCLIIDEIGHCVFDKENTRPFSDLIDQRHNKEGNFNMIFISNKKPALWRKDFRGRSHAALHT